jgi:hypothetical protein
MSIETRGARLAVNVECPFCDRVMDSSRERETYTCRYRDCSNFGVEWHNVEPAQVTLSREETP